SAMAFRDAYESMGLDFSGMRSVTMQKIWHLIQVCLCCYLVERVLPAALGGAVGNLEKIQAFLRVHSITSLSFSHMFSM
ncbi:hypothetical protein B296_00005378, partial [Ensete ventricosum]